MDDGQRERRRALGIPIHDAEADHVYVDGYCTCGARQRSQPQARTAIPPCGRTAGKPNLDVVEQNWEEYR
jgi:hypothetical protein